MDTKKTINTLFASKLFGDYVVRYNTNMEMFCITDLERYFDATSKKIYTWENKISTQKLKRLMGEMYRCGRSTIAREGSTGKKETWVNLTLFIDYARFLGIETFAVVIKKMEKAVIEKMEEVT